MNKKIVFGGYDGRDVDAIAEAIANDARIAGQQVEFRHICEIVLSLLEPDDDGDINDVRCI